MNFLSQNDDTKTSSIHLLDGAMNSALSDTTPNALLLSQPLIADEQSHSQYNSLLWLNGQRRLRSKRLRRSR